MMMAVGQFLMFASASMLEARELSHWLMYGGLTFLILGNGCFKAHRLLPGGAALRAG